MHSRGWRPWCGRSISSPPLKRSTHRTRAWWACSTNASRRPPNCWPTRALGWVPSPLWSLQPGGNVRRAPAYRAGAQANRWGESAISHLGIEGCPRQACQSGDFFPAHYAEFLKSVHKPSFRLVGLTFILGPTRAGGRASYWVPKLRLHGLSACRGGPTSTSTRSSFASIQRPTASTSSSQFVRRVEAVEGVEGHLHCPRAGGDAHSCGGANRP